MEAFAVETRIGILRVGSISGDLGSRIATQIDSLALPPGVTATLSFTKPTLTTQIKFHSLICHN